MPILQTDKAFCVDPYETLSIGNEYNPGYSFSGWNTLPDGTGTPIDAKTPYSPTSDTTLYAQWTKNEMKVLVHVYSYDSLGKQNKYVCYINGASDNQLSTNGENNEFYFTKFGNTATINVTSPGVMIAPVKAGETIGGQNSYVSLDSSTQTKIINFTVGEFSEINISKIPIEQTLSICGTVHKPKNYYDDAGTIFGGYNYRIHWYDSTICSPSVDGMIGDQQNWQPAPPENKKTTAQPYSYNRNDKCFVNVGHLGANTDHTMHISCGYYDINANNVVCLMEMQNTGLTWTTQKNKNNMYSDAFNELSIDLRDQPYSKKYMIGYTVQDNAGGCAGIKFTGKYKLYIEPN